VVDADAARGNVAQYTYNTSINTVAGFWADPIADLSGVAGGTLEFDVYLAAEPDDTSGEWWLKIEGPAAAINVEVPLTASDEGVEPPLGSWQHYTFDLDTLEGTGSWSLSSTKYLMVFPTWGTGEGAVVRLDNVRFVPAP
jgi:hypothetical protein